MTRSRFAPVLLIVCCMATPVRAQETAVGATTRAEALQRLREQKAKQPGAYKPSRLERLANKVENDRMIEKWLTTSSGFYLKYGIGHTGGGIAFGPGYKRQNLFGGAANLKVHGLVSLKKYWKAEAVLSIPRLGSDRAFGDLFVGARDYPQEDYFGLGPASLRPNRVSFGYRDTTFGGGAGLRLFGPLVQVGSRLEYLNPSVGRGHDPLIPSIEQVFSPAEMPGFAAQPDFLYVSTFVDVNYAEPFGNPRGGGRYILSAGRYTDQDLDRYTFNRYEIDLRQYLSILQQRRVLALRGLISMSDAPGDGEVPFYLMRTIGGHNTIRGFRDYRFRDENLLLLQAEYRFEVFPALDAALFYDAGKVAPRREDLDLRHLERAYGLGFRFGTNRGVFMRIDAGFGSRDGKHFYFKFSNVF
jgi:hypothetical protein